MKVVVKPENYNEYSTEVIFDTGHGTDYVKKKGTIVVGNQSNEWYKILGIRFVQEYLANCDYLVIGPYKFSDN